eukprot:4666149-Pyramimonas_sp.AAC.1
MAVVSSSLVSTFMFPERAARETDPFQSNWVGFRPPEKPTISSPKWSVFVSGAFSVRSCGINTSRS